MDMKVANNDLTFSGKPAKGGSIAGLLKIGDQTRTARLVKTKDDKLAPLNPQGSEGVRAYLAARKDVDVNSHVKKLREMLSKKPGDQSLSIVYNDILRDADSAKLSDADVKKLVSDWVERSASQAYGEAYATTIRAQALQALTGKKTYAPLASNSPWKPTNPSALTHPCKPVPM